MAKARHRKQLVNARGGNSIYCVYCDVFVKHPTRTELGRPQSQFDWKDKTGIKEAWDAHKASFNS